MAHDTLPCWLTLVNTTDVVCWGGVNALSTNLPIPKAGLYIIVNLVTGTPYIGISKNVESRLRYRYRQKGEPKLSRAFRKYDPTKFLVIPLCYSIVEDTKWLKILEAECIADYDSVCNGYNLKAAGGGVGPYGEEFNARMKEVCGTTEFRTKISAIVRARYADPSYEPPERLPITEETREKQRAAKRRSPQMWITNGTETRSVLASSEIPPGWQNGQARWLNPQPEIFITDGTTSKRVSADTLIPDGWRRGVTKAPAPRRRHITNGTEGRQLAIGEAMPEGWRYGRPEALARALGERVGSLMRGRTLDEDARLAVSRATREAMAAPEVRAKLQQPRRLGIWITDGTITRRLVPDAPIPEGWRAGRKGSPQAIA